MRFLLVLLSILPFIKVNQAFKLTKNYSGKQLLNSFNFESGTSQNNGLANYVTSTQARKEHLVSISKHNSAVTLRTSTKQSVSHRDSIRLISKDSFNQGLFIFDVSHMPAGCANWPSIWLIGQGTWPQSGEIDIIEGVHDFSTNAMSTHTDAGCSQQRSGFTGSFMMSGKQANNCNAYATNSQGCGVRSSNQASFGSAFNRKGGGVFALRWDNTGLSTYFFPRHSIPHDIQSGKPNPGAWGTPENFVAANSCHPTQHFKNMNIVINNDICGTWAGGVWNQDTSYAGQKGSCASKTNSNSCNSFAQNHGDSFKEAYWTINSIKVYH